MRGPRRCASTLTSTSRPSIAGEPTLMSLPFRSSRTRPSFNEEPGSAARRSTRIWSPGATRYCLPPLTTTADSDSSGLGTAKHSTNCRWVLPGEGQRGDYEGEDQQGVRRDRPRVEPARPFRTPLRKNSADQDGRKRCDHADAEEANRARDVIGRRRKEQGREESAV